LHLNRALLLTEQFILLLQPTLDWVTQWFQRTFVLPKVVIIQILLKFYLFFAILEIRQLKHFRKLFQVDLNWAKTVLFDLLFFYWLVSACCLLVSLIVKILNHLFNYSLDVVIKLKVTLDVLLLNIFVFWWGSFEGIFEYFLNKLPNKFELLFIWFRV
jgi:hypothetical protein